MLFRSEHANTKIVKLAITPGRSGVEIAGVDSMGGVAWSSVAGTVAGASVGGLAMVGFWSLGDETGSCDQAHPPKIKTAINNVAAAVC